MKKAMKIGAFAFVATLALASCKKDWNCECKVGTATNSTPIKDSKKKDAQSTCDKLDTAAKLIGGSCKLK